MKPLVQRLVFSNVIISDPDAQALDVELGDCIGLDFDDTVYGCTDEGACNYNPDAEADDGSCTYAEGTCDCDGNPTDDYCDCDGNVDDDCGICGGDGSACEAVQLSFGDVSDGNLEILISTPTDVAGFQFDVTGVELSGASGGLAADYGFTVFNWYKHCNWIFFNG